MAEGKEISPLWAFVFITAYGVICGAIGGYIVLTICR